MQAVASRNASVYVIGHATGPQKVGFSSAPHFRAQGLKVAGEAAPTIHHQRRVPYVDVRGIEALAHWIMRDTALGGERFDVSPGFAREAVDAAVKGYALGERAPTKTAPGKERIRIPLPANVVALVNEWRSRQMGETPSFAEAVIRLAELGAIHPEP